MILFSLLSPLFWEPGDVEREDDLVLGRSEENAIPKTQRRGGSEKEGECGVSASNYCLIVLSLLCSIHFL